VHRRASSLLFHASRDSSEVFLKATVDHSSLLSVAVGLPIKQSCPPSMYGHLHTLSGWICPCVKLHDKEEM
jgi:hypothetical protein